MKSLFLVLFTFFFSFSSIYSQTTYYVSNSGSNSNNGLSIDEAFATLQYAADQVEAGDSVIVLEGEYTGFDIRTNGTESNPIVFKAVNENVIINLPNSETNDGINIEGADWIVIDGFTVEEQPRAGIRAVLGDHIVIRNNVCRNNYMWGIFTGFTDDILIENNSCSYSEDEHGIYVSNSGDRPIVRNNICLYNNGSGIQLNADASQGDDGIITNAVIESNIIYENGNGGGAAINLDGVQESLIYNNLLFDNHATGIALFMIDGAEGSKNNKIYNNTIVNPADSRWGILAVNGSSGNSLLNNIIINHHSFRGGIAIDETSEEGFNSDYNLLVNRLSNDDGNSNMSLEEWQELGFDLHSLIADSDEDIFKDHSKNDYSLKPGSQPVDKGSSLVSSIVNDDINGMNRPMGLAFDIGAYEFASTTSAEKNETFPGDFKLYQNYPNPFNPVTKIKYNIVLNVERRHISSLQKVNLRVFDILGNEVATLVNEFKSPGEYEVTFDASELPSGVYFYSLNAGSFSQTKKLILIK